MGWTFLFKAWVKPFLKFSATNVNRVLPKSKNKSVKGIPTSVLFSSYAASCCISCSLVVIAVFDNRLSRLMRTLKFVTYYLLLGITGTIIFT